MEELTHQTPQPEQPAAQSAAQSAPPVPDAALPQAGPAPEPPKGKRKKKAGGPKKKLWFARHKVLTVILILVVALGAFLYWKTKTAAAAASASTYQFVRTTTLQKTSLDNMVSVSGTVASGSVASVTVADTAKTYKVSGVNVEVGDHVNNGDVICTLDTSDLDKSIASANTNFNDTLQSAQLSYSRAKDAYDTYIVQHDNNLIDLQSAIDTADKALTDAQNAQTSAQDAYNSAKSAFDGYNGTVTSLQAAYNACTTQINAAKAAYDTAVDALAAAAQSLNNAGSAYNSAYLAYMGANQADAEALAAAKGVLEGAARALESAWAAYGAGTVSTLTPSATNARTVAAPTAPTIDAANAQLTVIGLTLSAPGASTLVDAYNTATDGLITAESNATTAAGGKTYDQIVSEYSKAQTALAGAQQTLTQAETGKTSADKAVESAEQGVKNAHDSYDKEKNYSNLKSLKQSMEDAAIKLQQSKRTPDTLTTLQNTLAECTLTATMSGTVTALNATVGSACTGVVATIQDTNGLTVEVTIPANDVASVSTGMSCQITSDSTGDRQITGTLTQIDPVANDKGTFGAKVTVTGDATDLMIGMQAKVAIMQSETDNVFVVPSDAIATAEDASGSSYVYRKTGGEGADMTFEKVTVTPGASNDYYTEISGSDLKEGDVIRASADLTQGLETVDTRDSFEQAYGGEMGGGSVTVSAEPVDGGGAPPDGGGGGGGGPQGGGA